MKRGNPIPEGIQDFIIKTGTDGPELSASRIAVMVEGKFGHSIDQSTVSRYLKNSGIARGKSNRQPLPTPTNTDDNGNDQIRQAIAAHQSDLLDLIEVLCQSVRAFPPGTYLVGFFSEESEIKPNLPDQESLLWESLQEHLSGDEVWDLFRVWRAEANQFVQAMHDVGELAVVAGEEEFKATVMLTTPIEGARLTTAFPDAVREIVFAWAQHNGAEPPNADLSVGDAGMLYLRGSIYLTERIDLDDGELMRRFDKILLSVCGSNHGESVRTAFRNTKQCAEPLLRRLDTLRLRHTILGVCTNLCPSSTGT
ncbi:MAG: helix-turn-helix domain-containing protein [Chloroflexi bacterium]|nr:helix-turn-helix domain-containing protein [Chloroflexota bacterium]